MAPRRTGGLKPGGMTATVLLNPSQWDRLPRGHEAWTVQDRDDRPALAQPLLATTRPFLSSVMAIVMFATARVHLVVPLT